MKIHVTADWHANWTGDKIAMPDVDCDVHIVVGDGADGLVNAIKIIAESFKDSTAPIAYISGNHDYYISEKEPNAYYQEQLERARILAPQLGVHLLSNDTLIVGNTLRVVGSTLWTDIRAGTDTISRKMKMLLRAARVPRRAARRRQRLPRGFPQDQVRRQRLQEQVHSVADADLAR